MFDPNDDEKFKQMLGSIIGNGPAPYDVQTSMEQPDPQADPSPSRLQLSAPTMPQSAAPMGLGGYTPPPAAAPPQYLDHVQGHQFGAADLAMLGGILAAALGGGKFRGAAMGSLAGQYGGAVMEANQRADNRNQQIDQYNNQLSNKANDPLERWKADQTAQYQAGNLKSRGDELALQKQREQRIADQQTLEDTKDPVDEAKRVAQARADVLLDTKRKENDMEAGLKERLGEILGINKGRLGAPGAATAGPTADPSKLLKQKLAQAQLDGIDAGTVDPMTGKPINPPEKPKTPAQKAADEKLNTALAPFEGTEVADESVWKPVASNPTIREKSRRDDATLSGALPALDRMIQLRADNGTETGIGEKSGEVTGAYDIERGKMESALGVLKNIGVISPTEAANLAKTIPTLGPGLSDASRLVGLGDSTLGKLKGARGEWEDLIARGRAKYGLRAKSTGGDEQPVGETTSGIKLSVDTGKLDSFNKGEGGGFGPSDSTGKPSNETPGGKKLTTVVSPDGKKTKSAEMDDEQRARFQAAGWTVR